ncbi:MAG: hypothetical protein K5886_02630 [Lachnospiraceae bacterium]|nr:hypothetical protein [Lachnospiraceae bacterium]
MKKKLIIVAVVVLTITVLEAVLAAIFKTKSEYMEMLYFISQIVNCIVVAFGVIYAAWQYYLSANDSKRNSDIIRVQKAIDLAQFFKDNILDKYPPLNYIMDQSGSNQILKKISPSDMKSFDYQEMRRYITEKDSEQLRKIQDSNEFLKALIDANGIFNMHFEINTIVNNIKDVGENKKEITFSIVKTPVINTFLNDYINQTLNNLEYLAMHFTHNTADSSVVYQSLHQIYIKAVEQLYYFIANLNKDPVEKYYTNTIALYHRWKTERGQNDIKRSDHDEQFQTHGTIVK